MSRLAAAFDRSRSQGRVALIPFLTVGYPDASATPDLVSAVVAGGADIVELGVPFSDPLADGATIQKASATALGRLLLVYRYEANIVGGTIIALFGLFMTGLIKLPWLERDLRFHTHVAGGRPLGAYGLGLAFGAGWTPCIGPVLGVILTMSAVSSNTGTGIALLSAYALGLGLPFLAAAFFTGGLVRRLKTLRRTGRALQIGTGAIMIVMGIAVMTGQLTVFSWWLLRTFPALGRIG